MRQIASIPSVCLIALLLAPLHCAGVGSPFYIAKRFEANVVDAVTGQPVSGAIVTANWELVSGGSINRYRGELEIRETITDAIGNFQISGFIRFNAQLHELWNRDPQVLVYKDGYEPLIIANTYENAGAILGIRRISQVHLQQIRLTPFKGSSAEHAAQMHGFAGRFHFGYKACNWKQAPMMTAALLKKRRWFIERQIPNRLVSIEDMERASTCGPVASHLAEHLRD